MSTAISTVVQEKEVSYVPFGVDPADQSNAIRLSVSLIKQFIAVRTKSGATCDDLQAMKAVMLCKARKLNPWEGDVYLIGFDTNDGPKFTLVTAHQAFLKRAEVHPEFDGMTSGVIVKEKDGKLVEQEGDFYTSEQTLVGGWAKVFFRTRTHPMYKKLNLSVFRKPFGVWNSDPAGMIVKCAEADALRSRFPTLLGGMHLQQEIEAHQTEVTVMPPTQSRLLHPRNTLPPAPAIAVGGSSAAPEATRVSSGESTPPASREEPPAATTPRRGRPPGPRPAPVVAPAPEPIKEPELDPAPIQPSLSDPDPDPGAGDPFAASGAAEPATAPAPALQPIEPSEDPMETTLRIRRALTDAKLTEVQLMDWARSQEMANAKQTYIGQMAGSKLEVICQKWPEIVEEIRIGV